MPSPFPGMDPYLERPRDWRHVHNTLAGAICDAFNASLPGGFYAMLEERLEIGPDEPGGNRTVISDVGVLKGRGGGPAAAATAARTELTPASRVRSAPELSELYIEVFEEGGAKVTQVEVLSPSNKGRHRRRYLRRRRSLLYSDVGLVEIDLLRGGERPCENADGGPTVWVPDGTSYVVLVSRPWERGGAEAGFEWDAFFLAPDDVLPVVPVPLREGVPDAPLDLQHCFTVAYDRGPYRREPGRFYDAPPVPPLPPAAAEWAESRVAAWRAAG